jgi:hypothetical protein
VPISQKSPIFLYQCMGFTQVRAYVVSQQNGDFFRAIIPEVGYLFVIQAF